MTTNTLMFKTRVNNFENTPMWDVVVQAETGQPIRVSIIDPRDGEVEMRLIFPGASANLIASALGTAAQIENEQLKEDLINGE